MDLLPTVLDLAQITHPNTTAPSARTKLPYRGRQVYGMRGKSMVDWLTGPKKSGSNTERMFGETQGIHGESDPAVGWEHLGRAALRKGRYKIVNQPLDAHGKLSHLECELMSRYRLLAVVRPRYRQRRDDRPGI